MTDDLNDLLARRADQARQPQHPDQVLVLVASRAEKHTRDRRNRLVTASGAAVLVAAASIGVAVADTGTAPSPRPSGLQVGERPGRVPVHPKATVTFLPSVTPLRSSAEVRAHQRILAEQKARRAAQRQLRRQRQHRDARPTTLVSVQPAPAGAETSIGLIPKSYVYLGHDDANTFYGPPGTSTDDAFSDGIVVDVHLTVSGTKFPETIDGKPGYYLGSQAGSTLRLRYSRTIDVGFQTSANAPISKKQAERIAATLDVRSTKHKTKG